jgi:hypothetical protein
MDRKVLEKKLAAIKKKRKQLNTLEESLIATAQASCLHPIEEVLEGSYHKYYFGDCAPPILVCKLCGYSEEGWTIPHKFDRRNYNKAVDVPRSYAESYKLGRTLSKDDMYRLQYPERFIRVDDQGNEIEDFRKWKTAS